MLQLRANKYKQIMKSFVDKDALLTNLISYWKIDYLIALKLADLSRGQMAEYAQKFL